MSEDRRGLEGGDLKKRTGNREGGSGKWKPGRAGGHRAWLCTLLAQKRGQPRVCECTPGDVRLHSKNTKNASGRAWSLILRESPVSLRISINGGIRQHCRSEV